MTGSPAEAGCMMGRRLRDVNRSTTNKSLQWQRGYGVVSFGKNNLVWVRNYIDRQKEHHASENIVKRLESISMNEETNEPLENND